jgi:hypothetical protein
MRKRTENEEQPKEKERNSDARQSKNRETERVK